MRILITGGAGEVGRYLAKDFSLQGDEIRILDRPRREEIEEVVQYVQGDLNDRECVQNGRCPPPLRANLWVLFGIV
jgi:nucleoside-diphosphate-sugar epimerase